MGYLSQAERAKRYRLRQKFGLKRYPRLSVLREEDKLATLFPNWADRLSDPVVATHVLYVILVGPDPEFSNIFSRRRRKLN